MPTAKAHLPHFVIKDKAQKGAYAFSEIVTSRVLSDIANRLTGQPKYTCEFDPKGYNKGRLAIITYRGRQSFVSFSESGKIGGRNSFFQSVTTALITYYKSRHTSTGIYFYFLPFNGKIEGAYFRFMYRLMATAGFIFLNAQSVLKHKIIPFNSIEDVITARQINKGRNRSNNSTNVTKGSDGAIEVYAKTYGANKKEAALLCIVASRLAHDSMRLFEIRENDLTVLPKPDMEVIRGLGNVTVLPTDMTMERDLFDHNNSLRSPRFNDNLLDKLGPKKCSFCECEIPELIQGAHIWPVAEIKKEPLHIDSKVAHALDGDNGIWLCENHHKLFDRHLLIINTSGNLLYVSDLDKKAFSYIRSITSTTVIPETILTTGFSNYLAKRSILADESQYLLFKSSD